MYKITRPRAFLLLGCAFLIHMTLLDRAGLFGSKPDLVFSLVVFFSLFANRRLAIEAGVLSGLLKDIFSSGRFGLHLVILSSVAAVLNKIAPRLYRESKFAQGVSTAAAYILASGAYRAFASFEGLSLSSGMGWIIPDAVYTTVVSVLIFQGLMEYFRVADRLLL